MGDDDAPHALLDGGVHDGADLGGAEVAGGERHVVLGDHPEHLPGGVVDLPARVDDVHGVGGHAVGAQLVLQLRPHRRARPLGVVRRAFALVGAVDGRQPDELRAGAPGQLDRDGVHAPDGPVERDRPDRAEPGVGGADHGGALRGGEVVRLQHESAESHLGEPRCEREVVDAAPHHVRGHVDVHVVPAPDKVPGAGGRLRMVGHPCPLCRHD
ncbi:hypothetical protein LUX39_25130 [Actinomadura madurae]|nr:hypothetical protein [Actinomadura madurae]MCP9980426.1 hypothetical protein [Actinomadura madurae]MCQ0016628.1 hypothetical protein [Actinomadura madurae]